MESRSLFIQFNNETETQFVDENGNLYEGLRLHEDGITILRFHNGMLDGDVFDENGVLIMQKPAIDGPGRIEFWRKNKLHTDNKEHPAVWISDNSGTVLEWWQNGTRIK